jgi:hypothetical protein
MLDVSDENPAQYLFAFAVRGFLTSQCSTELIRCALNTSQLNVVLRLCFHQLWGWVRVARMLHSYASRWVSLLVLVKCLLERIPLNSSVMRAIGINLQRTKPLAPSNLWLTNFHPPSFSRIWSRRYHLQPRPVSLSLCNVPGLSDLWIALLVELRCSFRLRPVLESLAVLYQPPFGAPAAMNCLIWCYDALYRTGAVDRPLVVQLFLWHQKPACKRYLGHVFIQTWNLVASLGWLLDTLRSMLEGEIIAT